MGTWVLVCLGVSALLLLGFVFSYRTVYTEERIASELVRALKLTKDGTFLRNPGLSLELRTQAGAVRVQYSLTLTNATFLSLAPQAAQGPRGLREAKTGEVDFDDYFIVESCRADYLTPEREDLLLELFIEMGPDRVEKGVLRGSLLCRQNPWAVNAVIRFLERLQRLPGELASPPQLQPPRRSRLRLPA